LLIENHIELSLKILFQRKESIMNRISLLLITLLMLLTAVSTALLAQNPPADQNLSIEAADNSYNQLALQESRTMYEALVKLDSLEVKKRSKAFRMLALQDWKYYREYESAKKRIRQADSVEPANVKNWQLLSRIERESEHFSNAITAAQKAIDVAKSVPEKINAQTEYAQVVHDLSLYNLKNHLAADNLLLAKASNMLQELLQKNPGYPLPSRLLLGLALMQKNGKAALFGWQSYFHIADLNTASAYLKETAKNLSMVLPKLDGNALTDSDRELLALTLGDSRFYDCAMLIATDFYAPSLNPDKQKKEIRELVVYQKHLEELEKLAYEYYRQYALGNKQIENFKIQLQNKGLELQKNLFPQVAAGDGFNLNEYMTKTKERFGAVQTVGTSTGCDVFSLYITHIVNQQKMIVEQYGYKTAINFTQVDLTAVEGYMGWFTESRYTGGWSAGDEIVQVRENYISEPLGEWEFVTDSIKIQETADFIRDNLNHSSTINQSAGLARKIKSDQLHAIYNKLYQQGFRGADLKLLFLSEIENYSYQTDILIHEGRHNIDEKFMAEQYKKRSMDEVEYHAKSSELVFSPYPLLALSELVSGSGESGHGKANKRIVDICLEWMKNNSSKIPGLNPEKPLLPQMYLLSAEQVKECYRTADPLYDKDFPGLKKSAADIVRNMLKQSSYAKVKSEITKVISNKRENYFLENEFTDLSEELIKENKFNEAVELLKMVTEIYSESWNAFCKLGDAYIKTGKKDLAIASYEKSLAINPNGENALKGLNPYKKSAAKTIQELLKKSAYESAKSEIASIKDQKNDYYFLENELNSLGYQLLGENKLEAAIAIFKMNVDMFPNSANVYDSYGEAQMKAGNKELAIENYEMSLKLNPQNDNAREMLKELRKQ